MTYTNHKHTQNKCRGIQNSIHNGDWNFITQNSIISESISITYIPPVFNTMMTLTHTDILTDVNVF